MTRHRRPRPAAGRKSMWDVPDGMLAWLDALLFGAVAALVVHHGTVFHAPNSRDVVNARFRSEQGGCYRLEPVRVQC